MKHIAILAGNLQQFHEYMRNSIKSDDVRGSIAFKEDNAYIFARSLHNILGYKFDSMEIIGTFYDRYDARDIERIIKSNLIDNGSKK